MAERVQQIAPNVTQTRCHRRLQRCRSQFVGGKRSDGPSIGFPKRLCSVRNYFFIFASESAQNEILQKLRRGCLSCVFAAQNTPDQLKAGRSSSGRRRSVCRFSCHGVLKPTYVVTYLLDLPLPRKQLPPALPLLKLKTAPL